MLVITLPYHACLGMERNYFLFIYTQLRIFHRSSYTICHFIAQI